VPTAVANRLMATNAARIPLLANVSCKPQQQQPLSVSIGGDKTYSREQPAATTAATAATDATLSG